MTGAAGGICETYKSFDENGESVMKSLNTGIVTIVNYATRVPPKVSVLTFAHEVGHNFGAAHDSDAECTPYSSFKDPNGNYIMFASATSGDRPNNRLFSNCSTRAIAAVSRFGSTILDSFARIVVIFFLAQVLDVVSAGQLKRNCFTSREGPFCGNGLVEGDEQCDCGYAEECEDT